MSLPMTLMHYEAEIKALDQARDSKKGIRIEFPSYEAARYFRFRLQHARQLDRTKNREVYQEGDPLYGASVYDNIICRIRQDTRDMWWVYLEKNNTIPGVVESLDDEEALP